MCRVEKTAPPLTEMQTYYIIRHKPTGRVMPARMSRSGRCGWSWWNPTDQHSLGEQSSGPRLFATVRAANNALTCWLMGKWVEGHTQGSYFEPPESTGPEPRDVPGRKRDDMEVVPATLTIA